MCCYSHDDVVKVVNRKFGKKTTATFWKVVVSNEHLQHASTKGIFGKYGPYQYKRGRWNKAKGIGAKRVRYSTQRPRGFHVYLTREQARAENGSVNDKGWDYINKVVKCICRKKDFITAGFGSRLNPAYEANFMSDEAQAVFKSIFVVG